MDDVIYANVGRDGVIVFEPYPDRHLGRLPVGSASKDDAKRFLDVVSGLARHAYDGVTLLVPGVPEAETQAEGIDALIQFRSRIEDRMKSSG